MGLVDAFRQVGLDPVVQILEFVAVRFGIEAFQKGVVFQQCGQQLSEEVCGGGIITPTRHG